MSQELLNALAIFVLAILVGFEVISKVPATLHTPLMSGANSIHGIVMVGAMLIAATADNPLSYAACLRGDGLRRGQRRRRLRRHRPHAADVPQARDAGAQAGRRGEVAVPISQEWIYTFVFLAWLAGAAAFVLGLHQMNSPATARGGNRLSAGGMTLAVVATLIWLLLRPEGLSVTAIGIIVVGFLVGGGIGLYLARRVAMTAMPQLVSLFNAVGGGAAALVAIDDFLRVASTPEQTRLDIDIRGAGRGHRLGYFLRLADRVGQAAGQSYPASRSRSPAAGS